MLTWLFINDSLYTIHSQSQYFSVLTQCSAAEPTLNDSMHFLTVLKPDVPNSNECSPVATAREVALQKKQRADAWPDGSQLASEVVLEICKQ